MEQMNSEVRQMISDLEIYQTVKQDAARKIGGTDEYGYPFEPFDSFSTEPLDFLETSMKLYSEAGETFLFLQQINRQSPLFYQLSEQLEKLVSQLGSVCVTKAVMEQQEGKTFELTENLTVDWLRELTAYNFRKCYKAFMETNAFLKNNVKALSLSVRWSALDKRLLATDEKIKRIRSGEVKVDLSEKIKDGKKDTGAMQYCHAKNEEKFIALSSKVSSLPVDKTVVRDAMGQVRSSAGDGFAGSCLNPKDLSLPDDASPVTEDYNEVSEDGDFRIGAESLNTLPAESESPEIYPAEAEALPKITADMLYRFFERREKFGRRKSPLPEYSFAKTPP